MTKFNFLLLYNSERAGQASRDQNNSTAPSEEFQIYAHHIQNVGQSIVTLQNHFIVPFALLYLFIF